MFSMCLNVFSTAKVTNVLKYLIENEEDLSRILRNRPPWSVNRNTILASSVSYRQLHVIVLYGQLVV